MLHGDILGERARLTPDRTAVVVVPSGRAGANEVATPAGERVSYGDLDARATRCAHMWRNTLGLQKGDRVAILANNRLEFLEAFFAATKSGIVLVPLGTRLTPNEIEHIVRSARVKALLYAAIAAETVRSLKRRVEIEHWIAFDEPALPADASYLDLVRAISGGQEPLARPEPDDLCCLLFTSGTSGRPKGVMIPQRVISWNALNTVACWQLRETDVTPVFTPLYHAGGLGAFIPPIFAIGGTVVLHDGFDPVEVLRSIEHERCTVVLGVPTILRILLDCGVVEDVDLSRVRWFISGGAPLPVSLVEDYRRHGVILRQGYGLTEVGVNCFSMTSHEAITHAGAIGRPMMFTEARIVDGDGREVSSGTIGELTLRGPHVSSGYWKDPEATAAAYDSQGFFHTGDLARCDETGMVSIVGRKTDMYITGGVNVYPPEVEAELILHEGVEDAAVLGVPDAKWGETGVAFVLPREGRELSRESLHDFLRGRLAKFKIPRDFVFVHSLPRTPYGKVKKSELRGSYELWV